MTAIMFSKILEVVSLCSLMLNFSVSIPIDELYLFRSDEMTDSRLMRGDDLYTSFNLSFSFPFYEENHTTL